jgi:hypothetical protein
MKSLAAPVLTALASAPLGQRSLPACRGSDVSRWTNCAGGATTSSGARYVGEYRDGKRSGQGTYTQANGHRYIGSFRNSDLNGLGVKTSFWCETQSR